MHLKRGFYIMSETKIDVVLPCYNPSGDWVTVINKGIERLRGMMPGKRLHLIVVNDGSSRNIDTEGVERFKATVADSEFISYETNRGKGYALRKGIGATTSSMVVYTDWDFPYDAESITTVIHKLEEGYDVVVAARTGSYRRHADLNAFRSFMSVASRFLNRVVLRMKFNDAQGGLKGMSTRGKEIFLSTTIDGFLFDTEFIHNASKIKGLKMCEIKANIREGVHLSPMGLKVLRREFPNFVKIIFS